MNSNDIVTAFEAFLLTHKRVSHNTFSAYKKDLDQFCQFLEKEAVSLFDIQTHHIKKYLAALKLQGLSAQSISRKISSLKTFFHFASERFGLTNFGKEMIFPKKDRKLPHYLTEDEIEQLLKAAGTDTSLVGVRNKTMLYLMYVTGMRVTELVELKTNNLYMDSATLLVSGKGGKQRIIPISLTIVRLLSEYITTIRGQLLKNMECPYLFASIYGKKAKHLSRQCYWNIIKDVWKKTGNKKAISPHQLRHSLATHLLKNGADLRSLQLWLGHEHLATVQVYTHVEKSHLRSMYDKKHPRS